MTPEQATTLIEAVNTVETTLWFIYFAVIVGLMLKW